MKTFMKNFFFLTVILNAEGYAARPQRSYLLESESEESDSISEISENSDHSEQDNETNDVSTTSHVERNAARNRINSVRTRSIRFEDQSFETDYSDEEDIQMRLPYKKNNELNPAEQDELLNSLVFGLNQARVSIDGHGFYNQNTFAELQSLLKKIFTLKNKINLTPTLSHLESAIKSLYDGSDYSLQSTDVPKEPNEFQEIQNALKSQKIACPNFEVLPKDFYQSIKNMYCALKAWAKNYFPTHSFPEGDRENKTLASLISTLIQINPKELLSNHPQSHIMPSETIDQAGDANLLIKNLQEKNKELTEETKYLNDLLKSEQTAKNILKNEKAAILREMMSQKEKHQKEMNDLINQKEVQYQKLIEDFNNFKQQKQNDVSVTKSDDCNATLKQRSCEQGLVLMQCKNHVNQAIDTLLKMKHNLDLCEYSENNEPATKSALPFDQQTAAHYQRSQSTERGYQTPGKSSKNLSTQNSSYKINAVPPHNIYNK